MATQTPPAAGEAPRTKKPGRPELEEHERRKVRSLRYTDAEWDELTERAHQVGMTTSEFARETSLGGRVALAHGPKPADPALIAGLDALVLQLSGQGNLANQIALASHTNRRVRDEWVGLDKPINETLDQARAVLQAVLKSHVH